MHITKFHLRYILVTPQPLALWGCVETESSWIHPEHDPEIQESPKPAKVSVGVLMLSW